MSDQKILITGGTGLLGKSITKELMAKGHEVVILSRKEDLSGEVKQYAWDINSGKLDERALEGVDTIIHLAGASIADGRWTASRKKVLLDSRVKTAKLLSDTVINNDLPVKNVISASAIGIYGDRGDEWLFENSHGDTKWISQLCDDWEASIDPFTEWGIRTVNMRIGIVLTTEGGALPKLTQGAKMGVNPILGNGKQWYSWIHIEDLVGAFMKAIENEKIFGSLNVVSPYPATNEEMTLAIEKALGKKTFKPKMPAFLMKLGMGKMSSIVLDSARVSSEKLQSLGYVFKFPELDAALKDLL